MDNKMETTIVHLGVVFKGLYGDNGNCASSLRI